MYVYNNYYNNNNDIKNNSNNNNNDYYSIIIAYIILLCMFTSIMYGNMKLESFKTTTKKLKIFRYCRC